MDHKLAKDIDIGDNFLILKTAESLIAMPTQIVSGPNTVKFHIDFILANSQIYRGKYYTNFFNQDFIDASVTVWNSTAVYLQNADNIHPFCKKLVVVQV